MSKVIFQISLDSIAAPSSAMTVPVLDITSVATTCRFRLIDCAQYIRHRTISIHEFPDFPITPAYTAISYVWRGNSVEGSPVGPRFSIAGAEDGDPVGVDVLTHACTAALREGTEYIWLDRLCIMQTSKDDKNWQINHMFQIYQRCTLCVVLPGGVQRLVSLDEPTTWINRGWTLQEALAPPRVEVIFKWKWGSGMCVSVPTGPSYRDNIVELVPGESAMIPLRKILTLHGLGLMTFISSASSSRYPTFRSEIFGAPCDASSSTAFEQTTQVRIFTLKNALSSNSNDLDERAPIIWRSALFRTSSRPVDMVFSIMGLFGVTLNTRKFDKDDRLGATIAFMQEILRSGGRASWLGMAPYLPVNPKLSTIPIFPRTHIEGQVLLEVGSQRANEQERHKRRGTMLDLRAIQMPTGIMDDAGYLTISRKAIRIYPLDGRPEFHEHHLPQGWYGVSPPQCCLEIEAINGTAWRFYEGIHDLDKSPPKVFAVLLGWYNQFSKEGFWDGPRHLGALLIKEHASEIFHVESYFELSSKLEFWVNSWQECTLCIGGPS